MYMMDGVKLELFLHRVSNVQHPSPTSPSCEPSSLCENAINKERKGDVTCLTVSGKMREVCEA